MPSIKEALQKQDRKSEAAKGSSFSVEQEFDVSEDGEANPNSRSLEETFQSNGERALGIVNDLLSNSVTKAASTAPFIAGGVEEIGLETQVMSDTAAQYPEVAAVAAGVAAYGLLDNVGIQEKAGAIAKSVYSTDDEYVDLSEDEDTRFKAIQDPSRFNRDQVNEVVDELVEDEEYEGLGMLYAAEQEGKNRDTVVNRIDESLLTEDESLREAMDSMEDYEPRESSILDYLR